MKTFTDSKGRAWDVELNVHQMKRLRDRLGVDLANVISTGPGGGVETGTLERLASDPCLLADVLWVLCEKSAKAAGVTDEEFGSSLAGDSVEEATRALLDELVDFFPGARRLFLRKALDLAKKRADESERALRTALESPEFEERLRTSLDARTPSPGSAE